MISRLAVGAALAVSLVAAPLAALAQGAITSYRCTGKDGKKYYGSTIPPQCQGMPVEGLGASGTVVRRIDPEGEAKAKAEKEAAIAKKKEEETANRETSRRNQALLATYTSEKDIEDARQRALADNAKLVAEVQTRIDAIKKRQAGYAKEMEFYADGKPAAADKNGKKGAGEPKKTGAKPPPKLVEDMRMAEVDLKLQEDALDQRKKQVAEINAKYDDDKRRFQALVGKK